MQQRAATWTSIQLSGSGSVSAGSWVTVTVTACIVEDLSAQKRLEALAEKVMADAGGRLLLERGGPDTIFYLEGRHVKLSELVGALRLARKRPAAPRRGGR